MKHLFLTLCILLSYLSNSQDIQSSKTFVDTYYGGEKQFSINDASFIFYNETNHELILNIDFSKFKTGKDTIDEWLIDLEDTKLIFKGTILTDNLIALTHHNFKTLKVNGTINFNGVEHAHTIEIVMYEIMQDGILYQNKNQNYFDKINVNLQLSFAPKEFKVHKKRHHLKKTISIIIHRGIINQFKPGMEQWINSK